MFVRTTRFLFLILLASACTLVFSSKALAESQTENDTSQTTSITTVEQSSQQISESTHEITEVSINAQGTVENHTSYQSSSTGDTTNTSLDLRTNVGESTLQSRNSILPTTKQLNDNTALDKPNSSKTNINSSNYFYTSSQSDYFNPIQVSTSDFPSTLQSSTSSGSSPVPTNLPLDGTGLVLRMLATVFQSIQNIIVTNPQLANGDSQAALGSALFYPVALIGLSMLVALGLLSLLLRSWRKSGFTNAARSDLGDLNMAFAATKRGFAYYFASSFFVTANIKNKTIVI